MSDFASMIGGGAPVPISEADPDEAFAYTYSSGGDVFQDLGAEGDQWDGSASSGEQSVFGGTGDDSVFSGSNDDVTSGQDGNDVLGGGDGDDVSSGGEGDDTVVGDAGDDLVSGDAGDDVVGGGEGNDFVAGGDGNDALYGGEGNDSLFGGAGNDSLFGETGDDSLFGQSGDDYLVGGAGNDSMWGGDGNDVFFFDSNFGNDVINDLSGGDEIWLKADLNGSGITSAQDLIDQDLVSGDATHTVIQIGDSSIRIEGMDVDAFKAEISTWVKIQP